MDKAKIKNLTKADLADYALSHYGKIINRKNGKPQVIKEFKKVEKEFFDDKKLEEKEKGEASKKKQENASRVAEKDQVKIDENTTYPVEIKNDEGDTVMHRPCKGGLVLGDPPTRNRRIVDGETVTSSMPHLKQE